MTSNFPNTLDNFTNPTPADNLSTPLVLHSDQHSNENDAIEAIEAWVGISGTTEQASHEYRIKQLESIPVNPSTFGIVGQDEGVILGTGTTLNVVGDDISITLSGTVLNLTHANPTIVFPQATLGLYGVDEGIPLGTGTVLNVVGDNVSLSLSGNVLQLLHTNPSDEYIQDIVGGMVTGSTKSGISVTYNDALGRLDFDAQTAGDARYEQIVTSVTVAAPSTTDLTIVVPNSGGRNIVRLDLSGLTGNRTLNIQNSIIGSTIEIVVVAGNNTYHCDIRPTGCTLHNSTAAWEKSLQYNKQSVTLEMTAFSNWEVVTTYGFSFLNVENADGSVFVTGTNKITFSGLYVSDLGNGNVFVSGSTSSAPAQQFVGIMGLDNGIPVGTGTWIDYGKEISATISGTVLRIDAGLSNVNISPTTGSITAAIDTRYFVNISGMTANQNFVLPTCSVGDEVELKVTIGNNTYALILIGDTGVTIDGGSSATEWSRLFISGESVKFVASASNSWRVTQDERIPCIGKMILSGADTTNTASVDTLPTWDAATINVGWLADLTNFRFNIRRAGNYRVGGTGRSNGTVTDQQFYTVKVKLNGAEVAGCQLRAPMTQQISVSMSPSIILCAVGDVVDFYYASQANNMGIINHRDTQFWIEET